MSNFGYMKSARVYLVLFGAIIFVMMGALSYPKLNGDYELDVPKGFPEPPIPEQNKLTEARVELGRRLFFDTILSQNKTVSCGTCHNPKFAFTDRLDVSQGIEGRTGIRNAPTLTNVVYLPNVLLDGTLPTLEQQVLVPIQEHVEFDFNILLIAERMKKDSSYVHLSKLAYDREPDAYVITRAISSYERTLISGDSPYDRYKYHGDENALTASQKRGLALFESERLGCAGCHSGFNFTNDSCYNIGLAATKVDSGRMRLTNNEADRGVFKVPTLRNVAVTMPYMHDGELYTLDDVLTFFESGGEDLPNKSSKLKSFKLTDQERKDLLHFFDSLTDSTFIKKHLNDAEF